MDYLCELPNDAARRAALSSLPPDLNSTYERILSRVNQGNPETQKLVRRALRWIANEVSLDFTVEALCEAVSIDLGSTRRNAEAISDDSEILRGCSSLVRRSQNGDRLELAHFTVKEFLQQIDPERDPSIAPYRYDFINNELIIAKVCLTYLMFDDFGRGGLFKEQVSELRFQEYPFREYALVRWWHGENLVEDFSSDPEVFALLQRLFNPSKPNNLVSWAQDLIFWWKDYRSLFDNEVDIINSGLAEATPLHYAAILGLAEVCGWLIGSGCDVNRNSKFGTPLHCALLERRAFFGRFSNPVENFGFIPCDFHKAETVELLLEAGADPNCYYRSDIRTLSSLSIVLYTRDHDIAVKLLDKGAIVDSNCLGALESKTSVDMFSSEEISEIVGHITEDNIRQEDTTRLIKLALESEASEATRLMQLSNDLPLQNLQYEQYLRTTAEYGQVEMVMNLLEAQKLDVNAADGDTGLTALHHAAKTDQLGVAQVLLDRGADLNGLDNQRRTALHHSTVSGETKCLQFFLQKYPDNSNRDLEGMTVRNLAAPEGNPEALCILSTTHNQSASFIDLKADNGATALLYAAENGNAEAISLLLSAGSDLSETDSDGCTSLHYAVKSGSLEAVEILAKRAGLPDVVTHDGSTALHYAISGSPYKLAELLRILIENGVDPCKARNDECTPLHILVNMIKGEWNKHSVKAFSRDFVDKYGVETFDQIFAAGKTLLERMLKSSRSISVLRLGSELIYLACSHPFPRAHEMVLALLEYGLDPNIVFASNETALMAAAKRGDDTILNTLLLHGADPRISASGLTALHLACLNDHKNILVCLRNTGIDWNSVATAGLQGLQHKKVTALHIAAESQDDSVLEYLLSENLLSNIDARTNKGKTPLDVAVRAVEPRNVSLLLSSGADTTIIHKDGNSAIHWAAIQGLEEIIAKFIEYGSDLGLPNSRGLTPELVARQYGHETVAKTIMDYVNEKSEFHNSTLVIFGRIFDGIAIKIIDQMPSYTIRHQVKAMGDPRH